MKITTYVDKWDYIWKLCQRWPRSLLYFNISILKRASLVVQRLRIRLPMQGTWVWALVREDSTCHGATKPMRHNYWACALEPASHNYWSPCAYSPCSATREATAMRSPCTTTKIQCSEKWINKTNKIKKNILKE